MKFLNRPYIPAASGTPSGTPSVDSAAVPLQYDNTNHLLYGYSGSAWRQVGPSLPISIANGGTGNTTFTTNGVARYDGTQISNGSGFLYDGATVSIGASLDSSARLVVENSGSSAGTFYGAKIASNVTNGSATNYALHITASSGGSNFAIYVQSGLSSFLDTQVSGDLYTNTTLGTGSTTGFFHLSAVSGTPSGTPSSGTSGAVPALYDTSANKLWVYNGGWKSVTLA